MPKIKSLRFSDAGVGNLAQGNVPTVAIFLAACNGTRWIEEQVNSILLQSGVFVSLFISVDHSYDGTEQWARHRAQLDARVSVLPSDERFGGAAPNFFRLIRDIDISDYDAIAFSDQDDIWFPNKLERAIGLIQSGMCDVYSSNVIAFWPSNRRTVLDKSQPQREADHFFEAAGPGCTYVLGSSVALSLQDFVIQMREKLGRVLFHDWFIYAFCRERGFDWFIDPWPSMLYRQHSSNQIGANFGIRGLKKRFNLFRERVYREQVNLIVNLVAPEKAERFTQRSFLICHVNQLRRRRRDQLFLFLSLLLGIY